MTAPGIPLKSNACMAMLDARAFAVSAQPRVVGMFLLDTRHLADYIWDFAGFDLAEATVARGTVTQFWSRFESHAQTLLIRRIFALLPDGFTDELTFTNEALVPHTFTPLLHTAADFVDSFELRGRTREIGRNQVNADHHPTGVGYDYLAQDGIRAATILTFDGFQNGKTMTLAARASHKISVTAKFVTTLAAGQDLSPSVEWSSSAKTTREQGSPAVIQAFADVETLASGNPQGQYLAAGIPNFSTPFGRDSLISAWFLLEAAPSIAAGTLRMLAANQGRQTDDIREEEPGKIPHELRFGELARCGDVPFGRYYGTTDATALWVILLRDYVHQTDDTALLTALQPALKKALTWIEGRQDVEGLIRYRSSRIGKGLSNTSWKDSDDGMFFSDGSFATGQIAVVEIQGYTIAALDAAAELNDREGGAASDSKRWRKKAADLKQLLDTRFWNNTLGIHAIAIDGQNRQVDLVSSNPGHLLWSGCLEPARAAEVADRLLQPDMWSGWGLRTAATGAARYQPLSYHNGSVWPHDTMMFAAGLFRYGLHEQARRVASAIHDVALRQPGYQLPELFGGYTRQGDTPPLIYIETCRPQAWAAAALVWAAGLLGERRLQI